MTSVLFRSKMYPNLSQNYLDASLPGSLSGLQNFSRALKERGLTEEGAKMKEYLHSEPTYTIHKPARRKYKRAKVTSLGIDYLWQIDLVDMRKFSKLNKGFNYLLTCIDVFSKYAWVKPIKTKDGNSVLNAFKGIISEGRKPEKIHSDEGKEFINRAFREYVKKNDMTLYIVNSEMKACVVERFNRTLKEKMWKYFTHVGQYIYHDVIEKIVGAYNKSWHRTIKMRPVDVSEENEDDLYQAVYSNSKESLNKFKLKINDMVRISKYKTVFAKGYTPNWSEEIFYVSELLARSTNAYKIRDHMNEPVEGIFYESELQKITKKDDVFLVEEILKKRTRNKQKEVLVRWLGYDDKFNSWEPASSIKHK